MQKKENENIPNVKEEGWDVKDMHKEGSNEMPDETLRKTLRGEESNENADNRDIVGGADSDETPQGREEAKNDTRSKANTNG